MSTTNSPEPDRPHQFDSTANSREGSAASAASSTGTTGLTSALQGHKFGPPSTAAGSLAPSAAGLAFTPANDSERVVDSFSVCVSDTNPGLTKALTAQLSAAEQLSTATESLKAFNGSSDQLLKDATDTFSRHVTLLKELKKSVSSLERRVAACKERAIALAVVNEVEVHLRDDEE